jgi:hypothetical protein
MSSKRPANLKDLIGKRAKLDHSHGGSGGGGGGGAAAGGRGNRYLAHPVDPVKTLQIFLTQVRTSARNFLPKEQRKFPITVPFCEVEARLGILKVPHSMQRVTSSGAKSVTTASGKRAVASAFDCSNVDPRCVMESGISRRHATQWTTTGVSEINPLTTALRVTDASVLLPKERNERPIVETPMTETVYIGYADNRRICYPGLHLEQQASPGKMETKEKLITLDLTLPAAPYDCRVNLSTEKIMDHNVTQLLNGWRARRVKRRWSYKRLDESMAWQIDVTEVTTTPNPAVGGDQKTTVDHEIEMELQEGTLLKLINAEDPAEIHFLTSLLAKQAWFMLERLNPLADALDAEEWLVDHPDDKAVQLALAQCGALRKVAGRQSSAGNQPVPYNSPLLRPQDGAAIASLANHNFIGCMPVNFSRHHLEEMQKASGSAYFCSEKTDGVRHLLVFLGHTAVLVDRAMKGKRPIPIVAPRNSAQDPFAEVLSLIQPGTVLDGEVVMNRKGGPQPRPIFIVFDVLSLSATQSILHLPFEQRLKHLRDASFRTPTADRDMFDPGHINNPRVPLPLVRKNFCNRTEMDDLVQKVSEERGMRIYSNGVAHNHLTDGIIFQPNLPYVCGTDVNLLKWKYLDTVTIDVELMELRYNDPEDSLRVACLGEEQTRVDMTRFVVLPKSERLKMEADRAAAGRCMITEVGLDPESGEWYYL